MGLRDVQTALTGCVLFAIASFGKSGAVLGATCHQLQRALCGDSEYAGRENASVEKSSTAVG